MATRRMFSLSIADSDAFLEMPLSTQALYFHLAMRADDDGFVNNPKRLQKMIGASDDDLKILILKRFVLTFDSGIIVIKHWRMNNYIQKDRYKPTIYQEEYKLLAEKENGSYTERTQDICVLDTQNENKAIPEKTGVPDDTIVIANYAAKTKKSYYDWSGYTQEEMTEGCSLCCSYSGIKLTVAEYDMLFKFIPNERVWDDYIFKLQFYPNINNQFETVLKWAIKDGYYKDLHETKGGD